jgi:hypothetical protein
MPRVHKRLLFIVTSSYRQADFGYLRGHLPRRGTISDRAAVSADAAGVPRACDPARAGASKIAQDLLEGRRISKGVVLKDCKQLLRPWLEAGSFEPYCVLARSLGCRPTLIDQSLAFAGETI